MTPQTGLTDEQLALAVRGRDKELYAEVIRRYHAKLSHYLKKFIKNTHELEDVLQEVFIKAYINLYGYNCGRPFSPWIYRIAHNEALNYIKKNSREILSLDEYELQIIDEKMNIKDTVDSGLFREKIGKALAEMRERYREPLLLYFFEEKSYEEISDILRVPVSTVGVRIMRGKGMLKLKVKSEK